MDDTGFVVVFSFLFFFPPETQSILQRKFQGSSQFGESDHILLK